MKSKKKVSSIAKAIDDAVFSSEIKSQDVLDHEGNEETRARVAEKDSDDEDIFTKDFSHEVEKPSRLRVLSAGANLAQDKRYKGKKVSRKQLQNHDPEEDDDLAAIENDSDDSEDEAMNLKEHEKAELGHMFEMDGVDYDDEEEDTNKKSKYRSASPDLEHLEMDSDNDQDFESEDDDFADKIKEVMEKSVDNDDQDETEDGDDLTEDENEIVAGENDEESEHENDEDSEDSKNSEDENELEEEEMGDEDSASDEDLGPDLSELMKAAEANDDNEDLDEPTMTTFSSNNIDQEVRKGQCIQHQLKLWDRLLELRISLQKSLVKVNQFPVDLKPFKTALDDAQAEQLKDCQVNLAKVLDQLIELKSQMANSEKEQQEPLPKKRKLNDYDKYLNESFESFRPRRNDVIEDWNDRTRIIGKFAGFETSVTKQIEHILADKERLVKRTKVKRSDYEPITTVDNFEEEIFDDDDFYHQLLRELIERKTSGITDPVALGQQWLQLQKVRAKAKKKVDTRASKGRKTRFDIHAKLVNFMAPTFIKSKMSEEAKNELFSSLFKSGLNK